MDPTVEKFKEELCFSPGQVFSTLGALFFFRQVFFKEGEMTVDMMYCVS